MRIQGIAALCLLLVLAEGLYSQDADEKRIPTVEELYLLNPSLIAVVEQATSLDRETKLLALDDIEAMIDGGNLGTNETGVADMLEYLSAEGVSRTIREGNRLINYFPLVRRRSVELLGRLGTDTTDENIARRATEALVEILIRDDEVMVKAEAAYALGVIGINDGGEVVKILSEIIVRQSNAAPDNNFAYAFARAIENIAKKNNGIKNYEAYTALVIIMQGNYTKRVKDKAFEVLQSLKQYN